MAQSTNRLIVLANAEHVRSLRWSGPGDDPAEREHLHEHERESLGEKNASSISEVVTDQPGRFKRGNRSDHDEVLSAGEAHNLETELERRALDRVAATVERVLAAQGHPHWILSAPQTMLPRLRDALSQDARRRLDDSVGADLTKEPLAKLERRFLNGN